MGAVPDSIDSNGQWPPLRPTTYVRKCVHAVLFPGPVGGCGLNVKPSHSGDHCRGGCGELGRIGVGRASFTKLVSTSFHLSRRISKAQGCRSLYDFSCLFCAYKIQERQPRCFNVSAGDPPQPATFLRLYTRTRTQHSFFDSPRVSGRPSPVLLLLLPPLKPCRRLCRLVVVSPT